jgi:hypothetical protein
MHSQIARAADAIQAQTGAAPHGLSSPGYVMSDELYGAAAELGLRYSSSLFPCPYYYAPSSQARGARGCAGRSIGIDRFGRPRCCSPPARRIHRAPLLARGCGHARAPIQVTPWLRLPVFGTSLMLLGPELARRLVRAWRGERSSISSCTASTLLDASDQLAELAPHQFDLRVSGRAQAANPCPPSSTSLRTLGFAFARLDEVASSLQ